MTTDSDTTVVLGAEWDQKLRTALQHALVQLGGSTSSSTWALAGSQEIESLVVSVGARELRVDAETFTGLTVTGPADLVSQVQTLVQTELSRKSPTETNGPSRSSQVLEKTASSTAGRE